MESFRGFLISCEGTDSAWPCRTLEPPGKSPKSQATGPRPHPTDVWSTWGNAKRDECAPSQMMGLGAGSVFLVLQISWEITNIPIGQHKDPLSD